jgi:hypothetical protein
MKKIVAIIAVSLMLLASCGKTKDLGSPGLKKDGEGSGTIGSTLPTPAAEKTFWGKYGEIVNIAESLVGLVVVYYGIKLCGKWCGGGGNNQNPLPPAGGGNPGAPPAEDHVDPQEGNPSGGADPLAGATDE